MSFTSDTSYRIRLVNGAVDTHFKFMIDNHTMQVIAADLVPIEPYETDVINIGMGTCPVVYKSKKVLIYFKVNVMM